MHIINKNGFKSGYTPMLNTQNSQIMQMDFGILKIGAHEEYKKINIHKESAFILLSGEVVFIYGSEKTRAKRDSTFNDEPWVLHVPAGIKIEIHGIFAMSEIACYAAPNEKEFSARLYRPFDCPAEERGKHEAGGTTRRLVRTFFEYETEPNSNLVLGEVIVYPGRWTTFPPHIHEQPELYFYKFEPEDGYGYCEEGENVYKVYTNSTVVLDKNMTHPQVTAPGYAMWYSWAILNLEGKPWKLGGFLPQYEWIKDPNAVFWGEGR